MCEKLNRHLRDNRQNLEQFKFWANDQIEVAESLSQTLEEFQSTLATASYTDYCKFMKQASTQG
jgi:hypothetical protein